MQDSYIKDLRQKSKNLNVLYVENCKNTPKETNSFLDMFFPKLVMAVGTAEAMQKYNSLKFDIIFCSLDMYDINGFELIVKIRKNNAHASLLILYNPNDEKYFLEALQYNVDDYLLKPLKLNQLLFVMFKTIKKRENEKKSLECKLKLETMVQEKAQDLAYRYLHEFRTDLPNFIMLQEDLKSLDYRYMLLLDISHFSFLNAKYGKEFANHVLVNTAHILKKLIHKKSKLYKTESDRFVILLKDVELRDLYFYCEQIISFFDTQNIKVDDSKINVTFNIGVDIVRKDISQTLVNCEYSLDKSKELGNKHYEIYSEDITCCENEKEIVKNLKVTRSLVLQDNIEPYFQAIQEIKTGKIVKYEVLARGIENEMVISPVSFLQQSEKLGLSTMITRTIIEKSFAFFQDKEMDFSIDLCDRDLLEGYLVEFLKLKLKEFNILPSRVTFEILEKDTVSNSASKVIMKLNKLHSMGFKIAVDDFGIENSNFSHLLELNLDFIKIDGLFIKNLKNSNKNKKIITAIVSFAKALNIKTVAEFVEDVDIYNIIKECGVDYAQGYFIGKPEPELLINETIAS